MRGFFTCLAPHSWSYQVFLRAPCSWCHAESGVLVGEHSRFSGSWLHVVSPCSAHALPVCGCMPCADSRSRLSMFPFRFGRMRLRGRLNSCLKNAILQTYSKEVGSSCCGPLSHLQAGLKGTVMFATSACTAVTIHRFLRHPEAAAPTLRVWNGHGWCSVDASGTSSAARSSAGAVH